MVLILFLGSSRFSVPVPPNISEGGALGTVRCSQQLVHARMCGTCEVHGLVEAMFELVFAVVALPTADGLVVVVVAGRFGDPV